LTAQLLIDGSIAQSDRKEGKRKRETKFKVSFSSSFLISSFPSLKLITLPPYAMLDSKVNRFLENVLIFGAFFYQMDL
jgi:hypothetical protein